MTTRAGIVSAVMTTACVAVLASGCARQGTVGVSGAGAAAASNGAPAVQAHAKTQATPGDKASTPEDFAAKASLKCENAAVCPPGVGMLLGISNGKTQRCTLTVVNDEMVATSAACLDPELRSAGASCAGRVWAVFAPTQALGRTQPAETIECSEVSLVLPAVSVPAKSPAASSGALAGAQSDPSHDVVLLKLKQGTGRAPLSPSANGVPDALSAQVFEAVPDGKDALAGVLRDTACVARQRTLLDPSFAGDLRPVAALAECNVSAGSAGAPVVDEKGALRAILNGPVTATALTSSASGGAPGQVPAPQAGQTPAASGAFALATNIACLPMISGQSSMPSDCAIGPGAAMTLPSGTSGAAAEITVEESNGYTAWLESQLTHWSSEPASAAAITLASWTLSSVSTDTPIGLDIKSRMFTAGISFNGLYGGPIPADDPQRGGDTLSFMEPAPTCLKAAAIESYHTKWYQFRAAYPASATVTSQVPVWRGSVSLGLDEQVDLGKVELFRAPIQITFSPNDAIHSGHSLVKVTTTDMGFMGDMTLFSGVIPVCH